jgi:hypothetical protein
LLAGVETADHAADYPLHGEQALMATADFFLPIVDDLLQFLRHGFPAAADVGEVRALRSDGVRLSVGLSGLVLAPEPPCNNGCGV